MVKIDIGPAIREMRRAHRNLTSAEIRQATSRAVNHTIKKARTAASRESRTIYKIKASDLKAQMKLKSSSPQTLTAALSANRRPLPVFKFRPSPRVVSSPRPKRGVSVNVMGRRKNIQQGFIARMKSGHIGVFAKGGYSGKGSFKFRKSRTKQFGNDTPISEIQTTSTWSAITNEKVLAHLAVKMQTDYPDRLAHELLRLSKRG